MEGRKGRGKIITQRGLSDGSDVSIAAGTMVATTTTMAATAMMAIMGCREEVYSFHWDLFGENLYHFYILILFLTKTQPTVFRTQFFFGEVF